MNWWQNDVAVRPTGMATIANAKAPQGQTSSSASSRKIGCIQAGASFRSLMSSRRLSAGSGWFQVVPPLRGQMCFAQFAESLEQQAA